MQSTKKKKKKQMVAERVKTRTEHARQPSRSLSHHVIHLPARKSTLLSSSNLCAQA
jgi:hypothetical protein